MNAVRWLAPVAIILFLVPITHVARAAEAAAGVVDVDDPAGDVKLSPGNNVEGPGLPDAAYTAYMDIVHLRISDPDEVHLEVRIKNQAGFVGRYQGGVSLGFPAVAHEVRFQYPGSEGSPGYGIIVVESIFLEETAPNIQGAITGASFCSRVTLDWYCFAGPGSATQSLNWTVEQGELVVDLPKALLTRAAAMNARLPHVPDVIRPGDALTHIEAQSTTGTVTTIAGNDPTQVRDRVPDAGSVPDLVFVHPSPATDLPLSVPQAGVIGGEENQVPVSVHNLGAHKRMINLSAEPLSSTGGDWRVAITPSVTVRAGETLNATLRVVPPFAKGDVIASVVVRVRGVVLTEADTIGIVDATLVAGPPLDASHNVWYAHVGSAPNALNDVPIDIFHGGDPFLTRFGDPLPGEIAEVPFAQTTTSGGIAYVADLVGRDGIPNPVRLLESPLHAKVVIDAPISYDVTVVSTAFTKDGAFATGQTPVTLQSGVNTVELDLAKSLNKTRLTPRDGNIRWQISLEHAGIDGLGVFTATFVKDFRLVSKDTSLTVPVARDAVVPVAADLPKVALAPAEEMEAFVNPGKHTVFQLDLRDDGDTPTTVRLEVENATTSWPVHVEPGGMFGLKPGQSARIGLVIAAPADAHEGATEDLSLVAKEAATGRIITLVKARAVVATSVDVEDESFHADDAAPAAAKAKHRSPGVETGLLGLALLAVAFARRRMD